MADKEYYITRYYGYGRYGTGGFVKKSGINIQGGKLLGLSDLYNLEPAFDGGISLMRENSNGDVVCCEQPLYLVKEGNRWYEFFSHTLIEKVCLYPKPEDCVCIFTDSIPIRVSPKPVKSFTAYLLYNNQSRRTPREFEDAIKKYTNEEIQSMVDQFLQLVHNATIWGEKFDELIQDIERRMKNKDENASSVLENISGSFAADNKEATNHKKIKKRKSIHEKKQRKIQTVSLLIEMLVFFVCFLLLPNVDDTGWLITLMVIYLLEFLFTITSTIAFIHDNSIEIVLIILAGAMHLWFWFWAIDECRLLIGAVTLVGILRLISNITVMIIACKKVKNLIDTE